MNESTKPSGAENPAPPGSSGQPTKSRPALLPLGALALIGLGAVAWLTFAVMESVISRESKQAEIGALSAKLETTHAALASAEANIGTKQAARIALQQRRRPPDRTERGFGSQRSGSPCGHRKGGDGKTYTGGARPRGSPKRVVACSNSRIRERISPAESPPNSSAQPTLRRKRERSRSSASDSRQSRDPAR